ncbi:hypothetical protein CDES_14570 (plasmid) [Corynebacterium deserti GIMN1.010]|uniref:Uncharacterized protein n=1 Tax=Corynebacterium deserti GIMN1.010 TaxID=931089 RepID=A0A0M4CZY3_9CORY|nr:hypothetical protein CDES_14570 [Corynebacterium deserti GIMN1.010]
MVKGPGHSHYPGMGLEQVLLVGENSGEVARPELHLSQVELICVVIDALLRDGWAVREVISGVSLHAVPWL